LFSNASDKHNTLLILYLNMEESMKFYCLALLVTLTGCSTTKTNSCENYLSNHTDPVFLQRSSDELKPSTLPLATESVTKCKLGNESMTVVKLRSDPERLRALAEFCLYKADPSRISTLSKQEQQACGLVMFFLQCLSLPKEEDRAISK